MLNVPRVAGEDAVARVRHQHQRGVNRVLGRLRPGGWLRRTSSGEQSLSRTVEMLGRGLPAEPALRSVDGLTGKVTSLLGAVAAGYATAIRTLALNQQEEVKQALLQVRQHTERGLRVSEAKFRQLFTSSAVRIDQRSGWHGAGSQPGAEQDLW